MRPMVNTVTTGTLVNLVTIVRKVKLLILITKVIITASKSVASLLTMIKLAMKITIGTI